MFVHEIVHLPSNRFVAFRVVWNLICGIPFLVPSFTYYAHLDHHRRATFGTKWDGEYLPLASMSPWWILVYLSQCLWAPPLALIRFGIVTPLMWICPPLRRFIYEHASSLVANPAYIRPLPTAAELRYMRLQECGCFLFLCGCVAGGSGCFSSMALSAADPRLCHRRCARFDELPANVSQSSVDQRRQAEHVYRADARLRDARQRLAGRGADQSGGTALSRDASPLPVDALSQHAGCSPTADATSCRRFALSANGRTFDVERDCGSLADGSHAWPTELRTAVQAILRRSPIARRRFQCRSFHGPST